MDTQNLKNSNLPQIRVGQGYDIHRLVPGGELVLGGVKIESPLGLEGYSDADVVLHSIIDALLGAAALGDIGELFPDNNPKWKGVESAVMLKDVLAKLKFDNCRIINLDLNIIAQKPRLGNNKNAIRDNIAALLELQSEQVNVKARTKEGLGPVGKGEAIEAMAVVLIEKY